VRLDRDAIAARLPHAGNMCLLDEVSAWDADTITALSRSHAAAENPLARDGELHAVHLVEYAAQAAAVHGALTGEDANKPPRRGVLAGLRNATLHVSRLSARAGTLHIHAQRLLDQPGACLYEARITADGRDLFQGRLAVRFTDSVP
jgi:predicted hotdog family 3-hydroxylacyl-ACP dehydratase